MGPYNILQCFELYMFLKYLFMSNAQQHILSPKFEDTFFSDIPYSYNVCVALETKLHSNSFYSYSITKTNLFKYIENFTTKNWKFSDNNSDIFLISAQNIDCGYALEPPCRGGSNEYPQSMFLNRNKKNNVYPCKPQFYDIKVGFKGSKLYRYVSVKQIAELISHIYKGTIKQSIY